MGSKELIVFLLTLVKCNVNISFSSKNGCVGDVVQKYFSIILTETICTKGSWSERYQV